MSPFDDKAIWTHLSARDGREVWILGYLDLLTNGGKMNKRYEQDVFKNSLYKILLIPLLLLLSYAAVRAGMMAGNLAYSLDTGLVRNIDTESYKSALNASLPIINMVYNSGKSSVSISREIKSLIRGVFDFDLDKPSTILDVQSSMFSYYSRSQSRQTPSAEAPSPEKDITPAPVPGTVPDDTGEPENVAQRQDTEPGAGQTPSGPEGTGADMPQPISSITYKEDEKDENKENGEVVSHNKIVVQNYTNFKIDIEKLLNEPLNIKFDKKGPKVLVYHTHTSESYVPKQSDVGKKGIPSFSSDTRYNVVRVGEELSRNLKKYGIDVLHNGTVHDTNRNAAYGVAIKTLEKYMKSYPSIKVFLDIHRDGVDSTKKLSLVKKINGKNAAQIMFVVGTNGTLPHPQWKENLKFALKLQQKLNDKYPGLARPVWISSNRYNQHVSNEALIIEIGGDGNLTSECLESTKYLSEVLNEVINGK
jgi:stage II sporulation protein P